MTPASLLIRADASIAIGTGHAMRCLALAQAWQDAGGRTVFAMAEATSAIQARLVAEGCEVVSVLSAAGTVDDASQTIAIGREQKAEWIVVDGYHFTADYQRALKVAGFKILFLDDYGHSQYYSADLVLNQNAHANEKMYGARESYTRLLLGPVYCLLRREFAAWRGWKRDIAPVGSKVLVTMGGSDPENLTSTVIEALRPLSGIETTVVVGGSNPHFESVQRAMSQRSGRVLNGADNMPELMARADAAIAGAGTTCWEMCLLQLPMALIDLADNQKPIANALERLGAAIHVGAGNGVVEKEIAKRVMSLLASKAERAALSACCGRLVDGRGTERLVDELTRD
jgi:UDP-2,4-diacetamido-2,4,6-trideoxy-beta-L-altropyranose hydrolase